MNLHRSKFRRSRDGQRGLATVELAIGALVMILLMAAAAEIGRVYYSYNTLVKSVRAGSRYLSIIALDSASVMDLDGEKRTRVANLVVGGDSSGRGRPLLDGLTEADVELSWHGSSRSMSRYVQVRATFEYRPMLGFVSGKGRGFGFTMGATSTMRVFR